MFTIFRKEHKGIQIKKGKIKAAWEIPLIKRLFFTFLFFFWVKNPILGQIKRDPRSVAKGERLYNDCRWIFCGRL
ncbi:MAG: hypothetical protein Ct9H300mP29_6880 [Candidatus Neomarinimicrobiota bacterium]|nr:MAG: hypothetical protein Ct9H300mP29_6880 [Candidatus Neomarinimicrobiota bacterium]